MGKRDMTSNINWFMNVPVEADGTLGIVDGISAPGLSVDLRAEMRRARGHLELPADQQPVQRLRPDAGPADRDRAADAVFDRVLVANRGRDRRAASSARSTGWASTRSRCSPTPTAASPHVTSPTVAVPHRPRGRPRATATSSSSWRSAAEYEADGVHPGYGFLSENADAAAAIEHAGLVFIGPTPEQIRRFGGQGRGARAAAAAAGVPLPPGTAPFADVDAAVAAAGALGFPLLVKSVGRWRRHRHVGLHRPGRAAGHGRAGDAAEPAGVRQPGGVPGAAGHQRPPRRGAGLRRRRRHGGDPRRPRLLGATPPPEGPRGGARAGPPAGHACRARRRGPCTARTRGATAPPARSSSCSTSTPGSSTSSRSTPGSRWSTPSPRRPPGSISWSGWCAPPPATPRSSGTRRSRSRARRATRSKPASTQRTRRATSCPAPAWSPKRRGRPARASTPGSAPAPRSRRSTTRCWRRSSCTRRRVPQPSTRCATRWRAPPCAASRPTRPPGVVRRQQLASAPATVTTATLEEHRYPRRRVDVLAPGTHHRAGPPGPRRPVARGRPAERADGRPLVPARNRILGNPDGAPGLECTASGPTLRFAGAATICLTGADDGGDARRRAGRRSSSRSASAPDQTLAFGARSGPGLRTYLLVRGGFDVGAVLGSASTFTLGGFGGHGGRELRTGDVLHLGPDDDAAAAHREPVTPAIDPGLCPPLTTEWELAVVDGPHAAPDFVTEAGMAAFYATAWQVHHHSSRTGVRLVGPPVEWARDDGGEAGLHPSNVHDTPYTVGAVDFTGDMPILLGPDGPSLGGLHVPGHRDHRRPLEARAAGAGRHRALRARRPRRGARRRPRRAPSWRRAHLPSSASAPRWPRPDRARDPCRARRHPAGHVPRPGRRRRARGVRAR